MNRLILLANEFPYGSWEPYLETEIKYYFKYFENVNIFSLQLRKEHKKSIRKINDLYKVYPIDYENRLFYILYMFIVIFDLNFYKEIKRLILEKKFNVAKFIQLSIFLSRSHVEANKIKKILKKKINNNETGIIYSYRFEYQPYVGILINKDYPNFQLIARAHRYDLYEERNKTKYIPLRKLILKNIDHLYLISSDGYNYILKKYPNYKAKISISRLGTLDHGIRNITKKDNIINIVSCSNIVVVKRLDRLIEALSTINEININWTHYGSGIEEENIKKLAKTKLKNKNNINYIFKGNVNNEVLMEEYAQNDFHIFVNVSESEGIPVSIMEANSFGIPCIATDVGGTNEIVKNNLNGFLLNSNFEVHQLIDFIKKVYNMNEIEYLNLRNNSRRFWLENYNADNNYYNFLNEITFTSNKR